MSTRNILLMLLAIACYIAVDRLAERHANQPEEKGYTQEERGQMDELVGFAIGQAEEVVLYTKPSLKQRQAAALAKVYGITRENMNAYQEWW